MKINNLIFNNPIILSPMAGVGDFAFRNLCRKFGADFSYSEMINVLALLHDDKKTNKMLYTLPNEKPVGIQLFGNDEDAFKKVVGLKKLEKFDLIDLNFGCPAPKIFRNNSGSALLGDVVKISKIVKACCDGTNKPVTCKIRIGLDDEHINAKEIAIACEESGCKAITVHGRTKQQQYSKTVDYEQIALVKSSVKIPVIGNGDVRDKESYQKMLSTKVDGVSLARASLGTPWIFSVLKNKCENFSVIDVIKEHVCEMGKMYTKEFLSKYFRKHFLWYLKNYKADELKRECCEMKDIDLTLSKLELFFKNLDLQSK